MDIRPRFSFEASVRVKAPRTWQRKWRDVLATHRNLVDAYETRRLDVDDFTRRVETFFKTCRELADWIDESEEFTAATECVRQDSSALQMCDRIAQTAKHFKRKPEKTKDPVEAVVVWLHGKKDVTSADIECENVTYDALELADRCIEEWRRFFEDNDLDPNA